MTAVHELYNKELEDLRKALDASANALAQHKIDNGRMRAELEEARTRCARLSSPLLSHSRFGLQLLGLT